MPTVPTTNGSTNHKKKILYIVIISIKCLIAKISSMKMIKTTTKARERKIKRAKIKIPNILRT